MLFFSRKFQAHPQLYIYIVFLIKNLAMLLKTLQKILFIDIETVSTFSQFEELDNEFRQLWKEKSRYWLEQEGSSSRIEEIYQQKAAIYAEFGKVICISMGILIIENERIENLRISSIAGENEKEVLIGFSDILNDYYPDDQNAFLSGHNIREFDIPYMARRMLINGLKLPNLLDIGGKKPWETKYILDTLELWKFGDYKHYTSLKLLAKVLGIPSPKDDIDGSQVGKVFWEEKNLDRIQVYCEKDVITSVNVFLRLNNLPLLENKQVIIA